MGTHLRARILRVMLRRMKQNITLSIDRRLLKQARVFAARRGISISQLLANDLQALTEQQASYEQAKHRALDLLKKKFRMGGKRVQDRDALHDRAVLR